MKYYYQALLKDFFGDETQTILCQFETEKPLEKGTVLVVDYDNLVHTAEITKSISTATALINEDCMKNVLCIVETKDYFIQKAKSQERNQLLSKMEEKSKLVKMMDGFKRAAEKDPDMRKLLDEFNSLDEIKEQ